MRYPVYLETTSPEERTFNYYWSLIHGLKQAYWQTLPDKRPEFLREVEDTPKPRIDLDRLIEESLELQRQENAKREAEQAALNGTSKRRMRPRRGHLSIVPDR